MVHLIVNPTAGNGRARRVGEEMAALLARQGVPHAVSLTESAGHATRLAKDAALKGADTVAAVGGDGTICETARGLYGTGAALGVIPAGTGNDIIKVLEIPGKPEAALLHLLQKPARPLDAGLANDLLFLNACGTGFDACVLAYSIAAKKYARGMFPYLWGVLRAIIAYRPVALTVAVDDEPPFTKKLMLMAAANGRFIGGGMKVAPNALPDDGLLDLILLESMPNWKMPRQLIKLLTGRILDIPGISVRHCRRAAVSGAAGQILLNLDGELVPVESAAFEVLPGALMARW